MTSNIIKTHLSEELYNRTIKLLRKTKLKCGWEGYNSMKKILLVGIIIDYLQNLYNKNHWITYGHLLKRNERLIENEKPLSVEKIKQANGINSYVCSFFTITKDEFDTTPISQMETLIINSWMEYYHFYPQPI